MQIFLLSHNAWWKARSNISIFLRVESELASDTLNMLKRPLHRRPRRRKNQVSWWCSLFHAQHGTMYIIVCNYDRYRLFVAVFLGCTSTGRVGLCFLWFYVQELPKAQPAVVLVLKRLRRRGNSLKSHLTDWEKPGIEPATPGLQDIGLSPTPRRLHYDRYR